MKKAIIASAIVISAGVVAFAAGPGLAWERIEVGRGDACKNEKARNLV